MNVKTACKAAPPGEFPLENELFRVEVHRSESCDCLVLAGEMNLDAASQLRDAALGVVAEGREVAVDWRDVGHVSAGALQVLLALRSALAARGSALHIAGDNPNLRRTLEVAGLAELLPPPEARG